MKRSELERVSTGDGPSEEDSGNTVLSPTTTTTPVLCSPTSIAPVEDSPIFSIPRSEVLKDTLSGYESIPFSHPS